MSHRTAATANLSGIADERVIRGLAHDTERGWGERPSEPCVDRRRWLSLDGSALPIRAILDREMGCWGGVVVPDLLPTG